jgi:hypothetical protein
VLGRWYIVIGVNVNSIRLNLVQAGVQRYPVALYICSNNFVAGTSNSHRFDLWEGSIVQIGPATVYLAPASIQQE